MSGTLAPFGHGLPPWLVGILILATAAIVALAVHSVAFRAAEGFLRGRGEFGERLLQRIARPAQLGVLVIALGLALQAAPFTARTAALIEWVLLLAFIVLVGWGAIVVVDTAADLYMRRLPSGSEDNVLTRKHLTQVRLLRRVAVIVVGFLTFSALLMTMPAVREYGVSLFASAGVAGLVVGLAARPMLANLIAGIQIAVTQPIRLEDAVTVEGEFGWIEEITTSYVIVRLWDWRRLVVPLSYFIEKPFQNWTRESAAVLGSVLWRVDLSVSVQAMRDQLTVLLKQSPLWDGRVGGLQVTDAQKDTMELRATMSARSPEDAWNLRCEIREKMIAWLQQGGGRIEPRAPAPEDASPGPLAGGIDSSGVP